uniref:NADH:ubiquinone oxidoreductase core subunit V3 n=1 Tax=Nannospalax galili TaxID=1026970 RepID=A0A8C6QSY8_NANGA
MAARLVLWRGRARALKAVLLEVQVFRGLASTVPLSAESGKDGKGLHPNLKKPGLPKDVVEPERGQLLATHAAAPLPKSPSPPSSSPAVGSKGVALAGPHPGGSPPFTDEGLLKPLSRKTLVEFPQKIPAPFQVQGSNLKAQQHAQKARDDSSSSSSSSSSSDSESDEEEHDSEVDHRMAGRGKGGLSKAETPHPFENRAPQIAVYAKEKAKVQKLRADITRPEKPQQPRKKGTISKPSEDRKEAKLESAVPRSQSSKEVLKQTMKEEQLQGKSPKPAEADHTKARSSAGLSDGPVPMLRAEEARAGRQPPAAAPGSQGRHLEPKEPEPGWKAAPPLTKEENLGKQGPESHLKAKVEILEGQEPVRFLKTIPDQKKGVLDEKTAGPRLEGKCEATVDEAQPIDPAPPQEARGDAQEPEPTDTTTYKNLQHHDYNSYTFLDLNLDLSKFRMPQPSSGRESPRH